VPATVVQHGMYYCCFMALIQLQTEEKMLPLSLSCPGAVATRYWKRLLFPLLSKGLWSEPRRR
jgi:hypothetical protein